MLDTVTPHLKNGERGKGTMSSVVHVSLASLLQGVPIWRPAKKKIKSSIFFLLNKKGGNQDID